MNMNWFDLLCALGVGVVCGTIGQLTSKYSRGGWAVNIGLGFVGAAIGASLSRALNAPVIYDITYEHTNFPVMWSLVGSVSLVAALGFFVKPSH